MVGKSIVKRLVRYQYYKLQIKRKTTIYYNTNGIAYDAKNFLCKIYVQITFTKWLSKILTILLGKSTIHI